MLSEARFWRRFGARHCRRVHSWWILLGCIDFSICKIDSGCESWKPPDKTRRYAFGLTDVPCAIAMKETCLSKAEEPEAGPEYEMIQVGSLQSDQTLLSSPFQENGGAILIE